MFSRSVIRASRLTLNTFHVTRPSLMVSCNNHPLYLIPLPQQQPPHRSSAQNAPNTRPPGLLRRFYRWFMRPAQPVEPKRSIPSSLNPPQTTMQRLKRSLALAPLIERFFIRTHLTEDEDLARLMSKTAAVTIYAFAGVMTLGTLGVDTKPLLAGIGVTGFTIGFALKEVATNFISGVFLVINKPFVRGCRIKIHGSGGGIEGLVHYIDVRYVHLRIKDHGIIMVPSAVVYTNPFTVFPADDEANAGFLDMTKPPADDPTKPAEPKPSAPKIISNKEPKLKMNLNTEPAGSFKKAPFNEKL